MKRHMDLLTPVDVRFMRAVRALSISAVRLFARLI